MSRRMLVLVAVTLAVWAWVLYMGPAPRPAHVVTPEQWGRVG
jgi:hypothetical protein